MGRFPTTALLAGALLTAAACTGAEPSPPTDDEDGAAPSAEASDTAGTADTEEGAAQDQEFPDVVDVVVTQGDAGYDFAVTISSPYDTPERYADGWRVVGPDGTVFGEHVLAHDHADEQPFTRTQRGVDIPDETEEVTVEARDSTNGYGGETMTVPLP
ncbi:hypothetical protein O4J56_16410 [Nocardiopsis sp. RSe5-2]|uniref:Bacterial spore germination immunoglobulin-like domain-containing protein n=1 Tax=Nocardiopsis endophytica TaxID=3018445 RepID=A0ABT4U5K0_9ACTN|nr:hypothetical protein [Nocardiopsis endophytica]MDA2812229.1 hypothetical protein [Nocardiopsis endophytica]